MEATERLVKLINSTYTKKYLEQVAANATRPNKEYITQLLRLLKYFDNLFDGTIWDWYTEPANLELNTDSKPLNCIYYLLPIINK